MNRLHKSDWYVATVPLSTAMELVAMYHYAGRGANTATYRHGLFHIDSSECQGVAWWIPPTKGAALATYPQHWQGVLSLSRLVVTPDTPQNACSFLISHSMKQIDRQRWPCLVTYADTWQGHTGAIYKASNWEYIGMTKPESAYQLDGKLVSRKAGPKTRTKAEMLALGAKHIGSFSKHKYVHIRKEE
jgi:hypothetical protein